MLLVEAFIKVVQQYVGIFGKSRKNILFTINNRSQRRAEVTRVTVDKRPVRTARSEQKTQKNGGQNKYYRQFFFHKPAAIFLPATMGNFYSTPIWKNVKTDTFLQVRPKICILN
jgi:hypothetical protein